MSPKAVQARPQKLVLDASVVLKSYLPEEGSAQAQAIFKDRALGHVVRKYQRGERLASQAAPDLELAVDEVLG